MTTGGASPAMGSAAQPGSASRVARSSATDAPPALALGCARLGSALTPLSRRQCLALLDEAFALGVRHFDTASIYGQGDSERYVGEALASHRREVTLATKAGQRLTPRQAVLATFKGPIRWLAARRGQMRRRVADQRAQGVPRCFDADFIEASLAASLRRLRTDHVGLFYLHSPAPEVLSDERLFERLDAMRRRGWFARLGVSCDDAPLAHVAARHAAVDVVQFAYGGEAGTRALLAELSAAGKHGVVRGFMQQPPGAPYADPGQGSTLAERLAPVLAAPGLAAVIIGTTRVEHLRTNVAAWRQACALGAIAR